MSEAKSEVLTSDGFRKNVNDFLTAAESLQKETDEKRLKGAWEEFEEKCTHLLLEEMAEEKGASSGWISAMNHDITTPWACFAVAVDEDETGKLNFPSLVPPLVRHYGRVVNSFARELLGEKEEKGFDLLEVAKDAAVYFNVQNEVSRKLGFEGREVDFSIKPEKTQLTQLLYYGSEDDFARVFQNFFTNAWKAFKKREGPKKVEVTFGESEDHKRLLISVADNGPGVKPKQREKIFESGVTFFENRENDQTGKGIGLASVKAIVEEHQGSIWVEEAEGGGAKFIMSLPIEK